MLNKEQEAEKIKHILSVDENNDGVPDAIEQGNLEAQLQEQGIKMPESTAKVINAFFKHLPKEQSGKNTSSASTDMPAPSNGSFDIGHWIRIFLLIDVIIFAVYYFFLR